MRIQQHTNTTKTAIGYVRVSTQEQATEGVSLDAQRDRLTSYCKLNGIRLIDIKADEGLSGGTLERPGLQEALRLLRKGRADTLIVVKLDRLSRSLRDVCTLVEDYFSDERFHLLSLCGMVNTQSAAGRMVLMNLANTNQVEREVISERTRDAHPTDDPARARQRQQVTTPARSHRRRVYLMLGATLGNIDNEPQFFQSAFAGAAPGDLLVFDAGLVFTDSIDPAVLQQQDPALLKPVNTRLACIRNTVSTEA